MFEASFTLIIATVFLLGSPGPATLSLAAVGATVGFTRGLGYLYGILSGLIVVILGAGFGIAAVFSRLPRLAFVIQVAGGIYLLWIAYRIAAAPPLEEQSSTRQSLPSFTDGLILNLLNPKAYVAFFAVFSQFRLPFENSFVSFTSTGAICFALGVLVDILWLWVGDLMRLKFANPRSSRVIRVMFAIMIVVATGLAVTKMGAA